MFTRWQRAAGQGNTTTTPEGGRPATTTPVPRLNELFFRPLSSQQSPSSSSASSPLATRTSDIQPPRGPRPSRASSIVSTRTGISIGTLHDDTRSARSIDLALGGRMFHINRDASRISVEDGDLPPYSPPVPAPAYSQQRQQRIRQDVSEDAGSGSGTPRGDRRLGRSVSFQLGQDRVAAVPKRRSASLGNIPDTVNSWRATSDDPVVHSAGTSFGVREVRRARAPSYGVFQDGQRSRIGAATTHENNESPPYRTVAVPESPPRIDEGDVRTERPPVMDSENDISIHYTRLIRSIDRDHRQALHARDKELAMMRERLNEVDQVYRKVLKARDFTIDDLQKRLANLEEQMQARVEKAQNQVEDQWEVRWKHRDRHLVERMRRMELESQKQVERAVAQRDEEWVAELQKQNRELLGKLGVDEMRSTQNGSE